MLATVSVSPSPQGHKGAQAALVSRGEPPSGLSVISPLRPLCTESAPTPLSLTLSLQTSEGATPDVEQHSSSVSSLVPTPSPLTISAKDHKPGSSSFSKLASSDEVRSTLFSDQSSTAQRAAPLDKEGRLTRVRVPVSRLKEVPPPLSHPCSTPPRPPETNHTLYTSSTKTQETHRDTERGQAEPNSYTVPGGSVLQQGELTDLRGSYGAVECPPSTLEISEASVVNAMPTSTTEVTKRGQEPGVGGPVPDLSRRDVSTTQMRANAFLITNAQRKHDKEMRCKRSQEDVSEYHSTTRKEELRKGINKCLPKVTRGGNKPARLVQKPGEADLTTDQDGMPETHSQPALRGSGYCSVVSTSQQRLNMAYRPSHTPTQNTDLPQPLPGQVEPSDLSRRVQHLEDLQHLLATQLLKEQWQQQALCNGNPTGTLTLENATQTTTETDRVFDQTDRVGDASATGLISPAVAPTSSLMPHRQLDTNMNNENEPPALMEWNVAGDLLMRATQVLSAAQRSCDDMELEDRQQFNLELCCDEYSSLVDDLTSTVPPNTMVSETANEVCHKPAQGRSRERTSRHRQTTATNQTKAKKGGSIRIGPSAKSNVQTNRLASSFTPPTQLPLQDLIPPPPPFPPQLLYHYLVGGQIVNSFAAAPAPPPCVVTTTQETPSSKCEQQPSHVERMKHTVHQCIQTTLDQSIQTTLDQSIQTTPALSVDSSFAMAELVVEDTSSPLHCPPAQTEEKDGSSDLSSEVDLAMLSEQQQQPLMVTHPPSSGTGGGVTSQQIASHLQPPQVTSLGNDRPLSLLLPSTTQEWVQKELVAQVLAHSSRMEEEDGELDHSGAALSNSCSTCSSTIHHCLVEHTKVTTTEELVRQALVQQAIAILQQRMRDEEGEQISEEHASNYTQTFETDSSSLSNSSLSTPQPTPPPSPTPALEHEELLTPVPSPLLSRESHQLSPAEISTPQLSEQTPSPVHVSSTLPDSFILSSPPHFSPTPSLTSRSLITLEGTPFDSIVTEKEQEKTPKLQQPVHTHEPVLSETPPSSMTSPPPSQLTSSASSDQEISLGQWLPNRHPRECGTQSLSEGELPLSPGDARWKLNNEAIPSKSKKQTCSLKAERRVAAVSLNPKSAQMTSSFSVSTVNNVGTSFMGVSEGEVKRPAAKKSNFAARPLAKSVPRLPHTTTPGRDISEAPGDEDDDTFAGVSSISDSLQPTNKKPKRQSLPVTQQLSPGEVRKPFPHQQSHVLNRTEASNASYSMPYSEGEIPHALRGGGFSARQTISMTPRGVEHTDHHLLASSSPKPAKDHHSNNLRNGIDVINISRNHNHSLVSSPTNSSSRSPSLVVSTSAPQRTHSISPRLIRVSEASPPNTQQEPFPQAKTSLSPKTTARVGAHGSSDHALPARVVQVSPSAQQQIAHVTPGLLKFPAFPSEPLPPRLHQPHLTDQEKDKKLNLEQKEEQSVLSNQETENLMNDSLLTYSTDFSEDSMTSF